MNHRVRWEPQTFLRIKNALARVVRVKLIYPNRKRHARSVVLTAAVHLHVQMGIGAEAASTRFCFSVAAASIAAGLLEEESSLLRAAVAVGCDSDDRTHRTLSPGVSLRLCNLPGGSIIGRKQRLQAGSSPVSVSRMANDPCRGRSTSS